MKVERRDTEYMMVAWVHPFDDDKNASCITVKRERDWDDKERWEEAEISWQFVGKNDVETMRVFAAAMSEACRIGDELNKQPAPLTPQKKTPEKVEPGEGWRLLDEGEPLHPGDGFQHPEQPGVWIDYECRPDIFRGCGTEGSSDFVPQRDYAHTWPWRRRLESAKG